MSIQVNIRKQLGSFRLDAAFEAGNEVLALLGGSGCGKSMTLRCIAGVDTPDEGRIAVDGQVLFDSARGINLTPQQRKVGLLFQNYALFPNMTAAQNISAGLRDEPDKARRRERVSEYLAKFHLEGLGDRLPSQLSGGQQQRVALARMLIGSPRLLMLDEPFSALDAHLRWEMEQETRSILEEFGGTTLLVSHNRDEVYRLCHKVAVYRSGSIDAFGEKWALFHDPKTFTSAQLTGCKNLAPARVEGNRVSVPGWGVELTVPQGRPAAFAGIRSHDMVPAAAPGPNTFPYEVVQTIEDTFNYILMIRPRGSGAPVPLRWEMTRAEYAALPPGKLVRLPPEKVLLLEA